MQSLANKKSELDFLKKVILDEWNDFLTLRVIKIKKQENKIIEKTQKQSKAKRSFFTCSCGAKILIVSNMYLMSKSIKHHLIEHNRLSGHHSTDEILTEIIKALYAQM